jgi:WD40 repeat protein
LKGFNLNFAKPERLNLLYTVRCSNNKVIYANGEIKTKPESHNDSDPELLAEYEDNPNELTQKPTTKSTKSEEEKVEILCLQFNQNANLLATGNSNGLIQIHDIFSGLPVTGDDAYDVADSNKLLSFISKAVPRTVLNVSKSAMYNMPIITMKWYPYSNFSTNLLFYAHVNGYVSVLDRITMKKITIIEETDEIASMDFNIDGSYLAVVGKDYCIKLYDTNFNRSSFNKMVKKYGCFNKCHNTTGNNAQILHTNRLQSVKFSNMSNDILFSGGWDRTVKIWDKRTSNGLVNTIHGPFICGGDGIDVCVRNIFTIILLF